MKRLSRLYDGRASDAGLDSSQFHNQPVNFWFQAQSKKDPDEPDCPSGGLNCLPGAGTVLAVLDTGIAYNHRAFSSSHHYDIPFKEKVIECRNFLSTEEDCEDCVGHGTQCTGAACGLTFRGQDDADANSSGYTFNSPAPGAKVVVCKVCHDEQDDETVSIEAIISALHFINAHNVNPASSYKVDVISLSFGFDHFNEKLAIEIQEAVRGGIIVVCCASNDGSKIPNPITFPGRLGNVLCIGACDKFGNPSRFSSQGREIDFMELGEDVWVPSIGKDDSLTAVDGTSYSTPVVAGLICRILHDLRRLSSSVGGCPWLHNKMHNVWCIRELLKTMSVMQGHHDKTRGYGKLIPEQYFKKGDQERVRICKEILGIQPFPFVTS